MPTYAYACKSCSHRFDIVQSFSDATLTECRECGGVLRKQYGSIGVTFNGSGFYRTDSRAAADSGAKSSTSSSETSGSSGESTGTASSSKSEATASPASAG